MNWITVWLIVLATSSINTALADDNTIRIGGGSDAGEYIHIAKSVCNAIGKLFNCQAIETGGTVDNTQRLEHRELEFGLAMSNIAERWLRDPNIAANYTIVRRIGGESVLAFGKAETVAAVGSWTGVRENASLISMGVAGELSGDTYMLNALRAVPGSPLADMVLKVYPDRPALIEAVRIGDIKLGFIVQMPNPTNTFFKAIDTAGFSMIGVIDPDMIALDEIYPIKSVTVKNAKWFGLMGRAQRIETANVPIAILAIKPEVLTGRAVLVQKAAIKQIQDTPEAGLLPQRDWMQNFIDSTTLTVGPSLDKVLEIMKAAANGAGERLKHL